MSYKHQRRPIAKLGTRGGAEAIVYYMGEFEEYQVEFYRDGKYLGEGATYFSDDREDALSTTRVFADPQPRQVFAPDTCAWDRD